MDYSWYDEMMDATSRPDHECDECRIDADPDHYIDEEEERCFHRRARQNSPFGFGEWNEWANGEGGNFWADGQTGFGSTPEEAYQDWRTFYKRTIRNGRVRDLPRQLDPEYFPFGTLNQFGYASTYYQFTCGQQRGWGESPEAAFKDWLLTVKGNNNSPFETPLPF